PIAALESPSHGDAFVIAKHSEAYWQASLETPGGSLAKDIVLACHVVRPRTGIDLITSKTAGEDDFFVLTLTAGDELAKSVDGMDYVIVLDVSGSMADDGKLLLSKDSIGAFIHELGDKDRFELMTFNVQPYLAFQQLRPAIGQAKEEAIAFLATEQARGGTVLSPAMADRKSTRLNSSHVAISYAVFCLKKKKKKKKIARKGKRWLQTRHV